MLVKLLLATLVYCSAFAAVADGNHLLAQCQDAQRFLDTKETHNESSVSFCLGLLQGVRNTLQLYDQGLNPALRTCWPKDGITNGQAVRIVVHYLKSKPAQLHVDEVMLTIMAFKSAYPCKKSP